MPSGDARSHSHGRFALAAIIGWILLFGLYLLLSGSTSVNEAMVGAAAAALACLWWARAGRRGGMRFSGWAFALRPVAGALATMPGATMNVAAQLVGAVTSGGPPGRTAHRRDADCAWCRSESPAQRALGLIGASLTPDSYVLREDGGDGGILDHSLEGGRRGDGTAHGSTGGARA